MFRSVHYAGTGEVPSEICGYDERHRVENMLIEGLFIGGKKVTSLESANIIAGEFAGGIVIR